jgi:hypothetical protein
VPQANDSITVTPGSGATVATHNPGDGKEYQVVMVADENGQIEGSNARYRFICPASAVGANKVHCDLFNGSGSGKIMKILSVFVYPDIDTAVTGTLGAEVALTRTTSVGTGGTAATNDGTSLTAATISRLDTADPVVPAQITARAAPAGGAAAGAYLGSRWVFTEETNAGSSIAANQGADLIRNDGSKLIVREGEGVRIVQGAVASVGTLAFEINFALI